MKTTREELEKMELEELEDVIINRIFVMTHSLKASKMGAKDKRDILMKEINSSGKLGRGIIEYMRKVPTMSDRLRNGIKIASGLDESDVDIIVNTINPAPAKDDDLELILSAIKGPAADAVRQLITAESTEEAEQLIKTFKDEDLNVNLKDIIMAVLTKEKKGDKENATPGDFAQTLLSAEPGQKIQGVA